MGALLAGLPAAAFGAGAAAAAALAIGVTSSVFLLIGFAAVSALCGADYSPEAESAMLSPMPQRWARVEEAGGSIASTFDLEGTGSFLLRVHPAGRGGEGGCAADLSGPAGVSLSFMLRVGWLRFGSHREPLRCRDAGDGCPIDLSGAAEALRATTGSVSISLLDASARAPSLRRPPPPLPPLRPAPRPPLSPPLAALVLVKPPKREPYANLSELGLAERTDGYRAVLL